MPFTPDSAKPDGCQEAALGVPFYHPCNQPAVYVVDNGDSMNYRMCAACTDHNVRNRGAKIVGPFPEVKP